MKRLVAIMIGCLLVTSITVSKADTKANWDKQCTKCHGDDGRGDTKMGKKLKVKDYSDAKVQAALTDEVMFKAIKEGVEEGGKSKMKPAKDLSDQEIKDLVALVRSFKK